MLIICSGVLISLAYMSFGTATQEKSLTLKGAGYAKLVHAKNAAHTAIQIAMNEINEDSTFIDTHHGEGSAWKTEIGGASVDLYVERFYTSPQFWDPDSIRLVSIADYLGLEDVRVMSVYLKNPYQEYVEPFKSPLTIATDNYTLNVSGSANLSGVDYSNQCDAAQADSTPAITIMDPNAVSTVETELTDSGVNTEGTESVNADTSLTYDPTDELIERLLQTEGLVDLGNYLDNGNKYNGPALGSADSPGVFVVDDPIKFAGGMEPGYGILIVRNSGVMSMDSTSVSGTDFSVAGNFEFNGLVVFENAFNLKGNGTPTINGSVLIGDTDDYEGPPIDINITGNTRLQYDCLGEDYAKKAASLAIKQNKFTRVVTFE